MFPPERIVCLTEETIEMLYLGLDAESRPRRGRGNGRADGHGCHVRQTMAVAKAIYSADKRLHPDRQGFEFRAGVEIRRGNIAMIVGAMTGSPSPELEKLAVPDARVAGIVLEAHAVP